MGDKSDMNKHFGHSIKMASFKSVELSQTTYREIYSRSSEALDEELCPI